MSSAESPNFQDGDTLIVITGSRTFKLHAAILARNSSFFARQLTDANAVKLSKAAIRKGATTKYRLQLVKSWFNFEGADYTDADSDGEYVLKRVDLDETGKPVGPVQIQLDLENGRVVEPAVLAWCNILGAFYNQTIDIGGFEENGLTDVLIAASEVLKVAEYLDCVDMVTSKIESTLLATGQTLYEAIAAAPAPWLDFSTRVKSKAFFREALIHAAGQFKTEAVQRALQVGNIHRSAVPTLHEKAKILKEKSQRVQQLILSHYPDHLQREKTLGRADKDSIGRASYANDIFSWIGLTVYRQWVSQMLINDKTHHASDLGFGFITAVSEGGDAYLSKNHMNQFHVYFPMSSKGQGCLENAVSYLKEHMKKVVQDILVNNSQLDIRATATKHFTCTTVKSDDYPWLQEEVEDIMEKEHEEDEPMVDLARVEDEVEEDDDEGGEDDPYDEE